MFSYTVAATVILAAIKCDILDALSLLGLPQTFPTASLDARASDQLTDPFSRLSTVTTLFSVETGKPVVLTDQWRNQEFLPFSSNQRCVVEFLRHYGWVFCWERALQLKRDVIPALEEKDIPLFVVGIGTLESGQTFGQQLDFPVGKLLVDTTEETLAYVAMGTRNSQRDETTGKQLFEGVGSMWSKATNDGLRDRGREDLNKITGNILKGQKGPYKPLMPTTTEASFVQGASFVFDGKETILEHYDESSGAHLPIDELLDAALR